MARRLLTGMLLGVAYTALPTLAQAQVPTDPVPLARVDPGYSPSGPGYGAQPMGSSSPIPMVPMSGYGPGGGFDSGMGGPAMPGMAPKLDPKYKSQPPGLLHAIFANNAEDIEDGFHIVLTGQYLHLTRQKLKKHLLAVQDPIDSDDGLLPPRSAPVVANFDDIDMDDVGACRASIGLYSEGFILEVVGMHIPRSRSELSLVDPGRLTTFFFNPPVGFEGTNVTLWDNADQIDVQFSHAVYGFETNMRWINNLNGAQADCFVGIRYMDLTERLEIFTDDDSLQFAPDPLSQASYTASTHNHLLGLQAGLGMHQNWWGILGASWDVRGAWCANLAEINVNLTRGDGFQGRNGGSTKYGFSQIYETGVYLDLGGSFWRVRGGYQMMLVTGIATAENQLNYNLEAGDGRGYMRGTTIYHGPAVLLDIFF